MSTVRDIVVVGAGGFAREVRWLIEEINRVEERFRFRGYLVSDLGRLGEHDSRDEVLGDFSWLGDNRVDAAAIGIGTPKPRLAISAELTAAFPNLEWPILEHPTVIYDRATSRVGEGSILCAGVLGTVHLEIGAFCNVNLACTLGHEARLGRGCCLNPTVNISGGVDLGEGTLVGTGAQILQYLRVGEGATVGAGAVVTKDIPAGATAVGVPAKALAR
ncbi:MAG: transferase [Acidobacteriota bacterium]